MVLLLEFAELTTIEAIFVAIPESVGVLIFGVVLILTAVLIRKVLSKSGPVKTDKKTAK